MAEGVFIQVFGQSFAGLMDMFMEQHHKVHMDLSAGYGFKLVGISPFSIMGTLDDSLQGYAVCERTNPRIQLDVLKNFDSICARTYCDFFVLDNSSAMMKLVQINNQFYSILLGEDSDFTDAILNRNDGIKENFIDPVQEGFSERMKLQYDLFIDAVLRHYSRGQVILIKSHIPLFRSDNGKIVKTLHSQRARAFIQELDNYFINKVNCTALDTALSFFEANESKSGLAFDGGQEDLRLALESAVISEIDKLSTNSGISHNLKPSSQTVAEYISDGGTDLEFIADYFKSYDYSFEDIVALFWLFEQSSDKTAFAEIGRGILSNKNGFALLRTRELFNRNMDTLLNYEYLTASLEDVFFQDRIIIRLDGRHFLEITEAGLRPFCTEVKEKWDYRRFVENNYACGIDEIDDALESWETYFERGRRKCKDPFILRFDNIQELDQTLYYVDYEEILTNERYVIVLHGSEPMTMQYTPSVDAAFLFDEKSRIACMCGGIGDQKNYYIAGVDICEKHGFRLFINDLVYDSVFLHNRVELYKLTKKNIAPLLFSNIFSNRLRLRMRNLPEALPSLICQNINWLTIGLDEARIISGNLNKKLYDDVLMAISNRQESGLISTPIVWVNHYHEAISLIVNKNRNEVQFNCINNPGFYGFTDKPLWERHLAFPAFCEEDTKNKKLSEKMMSHDAISIHIRRYHPETLNLSDFDECSCYREAIEFIWTDVKFRMYNNKHLYVFSDEMEWCKERSNDLGFDVVGNAVSFVDWNQHFKSTNDLHLMSLSRIIVFAVGGFTHTSAFISKNVEYVIKAHPGGLPSIEWQKGKGVLKTRCRAWKMLIVNILARSPWLLKWLHAIKKKLMKS